KVLVDVEGGNNMIYLPLDKLTQGHPGSSSLPPRQLTSQELNEITSRVTEELSKRVNTSRITGGVSR
ncbi:MAG: protease modulator HflK, partial [Endozoicomonas sp.]